MTELETLFVLAKIMTLILGAAFVGCLISDYIVEPILKWWDER